jgi:hypothetical protein
VLLVPAKIGQRSGSGRAGEAVGGPDPKRATEGSRKKSTSGTAAARLPRADSTTGAEIWERALSAKPLAVHQAPQAAAEIMRVLLSRAPQWEGRQSLNASEIGPTAIQVGPLTGHRPPIHEGPKDLTFE